MARQPRSQAFKKIQRLRLHLGKCGGFDAAFRFNASTAKNYFSRKLAFPAFHWEIVKKIAVLANANFSHFSAKISGCLTHKHLLSRTDNWK
jgi:hypothetical protein